MLVAGWHVERGIPVEEPEGEEVEPAVLDGRHGPVLRTGDVGDPERVPQHDVRPDQGAIGRGPAGQAVAAARLVGVVACGTALVGGVGRHPQVAGGEAGPAAHGGVGCRQHRRGRPGQEPVAHGLSEAVAGVGVHHQPAARLRRVDEALGLPL